MDTAVMGFTKLKNLLLPAFYAIIDAIFVIINLKSMIVLQENVSLLHLNTLRIKANARHLIELHENIDISEFITSGLSSMQPRFILGEGSNVLFTGDYGGLVIRPLLKGITVIGENNGTILVRAGAGENWDHFVAWCVGNDFGGLENLSGIPGTVGASPVQNIGAYGVEVGEVVEWVEFIDLEQGVITRITGQDCLFSYRDSIFKQALKGKGIIAHVVFRLNRKHLIRTLYQDLQRELDNFPETTIQTIRQAVIAIRSRKLPDPAELCNAGSFFKNPIVQKDQAKSIQRFYPGMPKFEAEGDMVKLSAAWLIEKCGWKGRRIKHAGTYRKHPLILVNYGHATGEEVLNLAMKIQKSVMNNFGIRLEIEVNVV
jgi:UDP-N-acetylmuramate dehydrogenase